ncbi:MAG: Grx4 family monothiol glutaredoxin [Gammaproteobacteria bacterium]|nr:Grx4 family monothiol glutaredoxin [Gammaproteobacteria bacterium]
MNVEDRIRQQLSADKIVLYMKGNPQAPQCGFSAKATQILSACGAKFTTYDILSDPEIRQGLKEYSHWPTFPQLYVNGELIGGCDIMTELFQKGELQKLVTKAAS